jgi:ribosomal protein S18 acetylase RimI-like enzyme
VPPAPPRLRSYVEADRPALVEGLRRLQDALARLDGSGSLRGGVDFDAPAYVAALLHDVAARDGVVAVAEADGRVVAFVAGTIPLPSEAELLESRATRWGRVHELWVEEGHRGRGLGAALLARAEAHFRARGCDRCRLEIVPENAAARALYASRGYRERLISFERTL